MKDKSGPAIICFIVLMISYLYLKTFEKQNLDLAVCILSSRQNFELRNAIRNSWFNDIVSIELGHTKTVQAKFVIGQDACLIHPENRIDSFGCEPWNVSLPKSSELTTFFMKPDNCNQHFNFVLNFYVKVMHGIVLKRIGIADIFSQLVLKEHEKASMNVYFYDARTDEEISITHFDGNNKGQERNGYSYRPVQEILLPKGYEFIIQLKLDLKLSYLEKLKTGINSVSEESHHGMIVIRATDQYGHLLNERTHVNYIPAVSFMFTVHSVESLKNHLELVLDRDKEWLQKVDLESQQLKEEQKLYQDIILVDVLDVYRNLPQKVLAGHLWLEDNYVVKYVMKTDDDCYVNIDTVLKSLPNCSGTNMIWWGNFRTNWAVEQHGKWVELEYGAMVYPRFACGSGNIVSSEVHSWLVLNRQKLKHFQGEDVSMGIWLSGLNVQHIQDDRWQCKMSCDNDLLSLPELSPEEIHWHWNNSKHCATPCLPC
ncbi:UDP-GalNAc:beta-1,3-N-acetylgalactosaminyltransferase 2-like [Biomphalaria glabrata]|uniref:Hexosyltransferase n=1 Tax=Biomphalaria glabrata TaxID=6526 RepID=A0A9W3B4X3_BIOGL|nr:UDP-GalNAc:beta-1,3-N-acetylgalactosaminyltransferase 2-like [Biomphalaria glabrata]XP_055894533.1 UDP-GalNAc:beta-1,3-N-acetylgalactosaminyltransferase 2-like [Biomphalaria glabrata]XP_055894534.1 UDP-GalNAc:beta-1,3-N-acetylgalactosaminyltransferase 2-like [Biomphalaria glabrata]XP_055894535.1 UDP-GalNAc:beta-1,3-N-acetylgalactosaminyltransferase 2-like [Biomphalaria glabrata]XP_055894536.1 UDP-GalNAc:beta-1,3-N-acetylgalactosaminyltransferase 2-like [Biomphalaria glabrata]